MGGRGVVGSLLRFKRSGSGRMARCHIGGRRENIGKRLGVFRWWLGWVVVNQPVGCSEVLSGRLGWLVGRGRKEGRDSASGRCGLGKSVLSIFAVFPTRTRSAKASCRKTLAGGTIFVTTGCTGCMAGAVTARLPRRLGPSGRRAIVGRVRSLLLAAIGTFLLFHASTSATGLATGVARTRAAQANSGWLTMALWAARRFRNRYDSFFFRVTCTLIHFPMRTQGYPCWARLPCVNQKVSE